MDIYWLDSSRVRGKIPRAPISGAPPSIKLSIFAPLKLLIHEKLSGFRM